MDPLELVPLDEECLWALPATLEACEGDKFEVKDEPPDKALDVGTEAKFELLPLPLLVGFKLADADLLVDGMEEGGVCEGRECGYPGKA